MGACNTNRAFGPAMAIAVAVITLAGALPAQGHQDKGKKEPEPVVLWLNSTLRPSGIPRDQPVTICVTGQSLTWMEGKKTVVVPIPDSRIQYKPWESASASRTWYGNGFWDTSIPSTKRSGKTFMGGITLALPAGLPKSARQVSWRAKFASDAPGVSVQWTWGAAAYSALGSDYNAMKVAPVGSDGDLAGTPVAFKRYLIEDDDDDHDGDCDHDGHHHGDDEDDDDASRYIGPRSDTFKVLVPQTATCGNAY